MPAINDYQPRKLTPEQEQEVSRAEETIRHIDRLARDPGFRAFMERIDRRAVKLEQTILYTEMPAEDREKLRNQLLGLREVFAMPDSDRKGSVSTLKSHGRPIPVFYADASD